MRQYREGELVVNLPQALEPAAVDFGAARRAILPGPNCFAAEMDPPREEKGGVLIPETVGARVRAHAGTIVATGAGVSLKVADRVLLRPYHGLWIEPFASAEASIVEVDAEGLRPLGSAVAIRVDLPEKWTELALPDDMERPMMATGRVVAKGSRAWPVVGSRVVFSNYNRATAHLGVDAAGEGIAIVEDRQIYATLGPSTYRAGMVRFYGAGTDWRKSVLMVWRDGDWLPLAPWTLIERDMARVDGLAVPELYAARARVRARVLSWGLGSSYAVLGAVDVFADPDPMGALTFAWGAGEMNVVRQLVPESTVWAVIE